MMNRTAKLVLTSSALFLAFFVGRPDTAQAVGITDNVTVSTTVTRACSINATDTLAFPNYDPSSTTDTTTTGTIGFQCTVGVNPTIDLGNGLNSVAAGGGFRGMANGSNILPYQIYSGSLSGSVWGTLLSGTSVVATGSGLPATVTMYGRIPLGKTSVIAGLYQDTVVATLNF